MSAPLSLCSTLQLAGFSTGQLEIWGPITEPYGDCIHTALERLS
jgi:hypothetical protein